MSLNDETGPRSLLPGTDVGAYRIVRPIGVGGAGVVYEAVHRGLGKRVALKTLLENYRQDKEFRTRFVTEGIAASRIRHPHVVDITDVGETGSVPHLVMELLEGETLGELTQRVGPMSSETIANIMVPVAAAIAEAHRLGVIHRDLKPDNVFLTHSPQGSLHPTVLDFGISRVMDDASDSRLTAQDAFLGTPSYASPEQIANVRCAEAASDQYSFGVILYELSTGVRPFSGFSSLYNLLAAVSRGECPLPSSQRSDLDPALERIILRAMSVDASKRFASMRELGHELLSFADETTRGLWFPVFEPSYEPITRTPAALVLATPEATPSQVSLHTAETRADLRAPEQSEAPTQLEGGASLADLVPTASDVQSSRALSNLWLNRSAIGLLVLLGIGLSLIANEQSPLEQLPTNANAEKRAASPSGSEDAAPASDVAHAPNASEPVSNSDATPRASSLQLTGAIEGNGTAAVEKSPSTAPHRNSHTGSHSEAAQAPTPKKRQSGVNVAAAHALRRAPASATATPRATPSHVGSAPPTARRRTASSKYPTPSDNLDPWR